VPIEEDRAEEEEAPLPGADWGDEARPGVEASPPPVVAAPRLDAQGMLTSWVALCRRHKDEPYSSGCGDAEAWPLALQQFIQGLRNIAIAEAVEHFITAAVSASDDSVVGAFLAFAAQYAGVLPESAGTPPIPPPFLPIRRPAPSAARPLPFPIRRRPFLPIQCQAAPVPTSPSRRACPSPWPVAPLVSALVFCVPL